MGGAYLGFDITKVTGFPVGLVVSHLPRDALSKGHNKAGFGLDRLRSARGWYPGNKQIALCATGRALASLASQRPGWLRRIEDREDGNQTT